MLHFDSSGVFLTSSAPCQVSGCGDIGVVLAAILDRRLRERALQDMAEWSRRPGFLRRVRGLGLAGIRPTARASSTKLAHELKEALSWFLSQHARDDKAEQSRATSGFKIKAPPEVGRR